MERDGFTSKPSESIQLMGAEEKELNSGRTIFLCHLPNGQKRNSLISK